jgi:hypothetical protein
MLGDDGMRETRTEIPVRETRTEIPCPHRPAFQHKLRRQVAAARCGGVATRVKAVNPPNPQLSLSLSFPAVFPFSQLAPSTLTHEFFSIEVSVSTFFSQLLYQQRLTFFIFFSIFFPRFVRAARASSSFPGSYC